MQGKNDTTASLHIHVLSWPLGQISQQDSLLAACLPKGSLLNSSSPSLPDTLPTRYHSLPTPPLSHSYLCSPPSHPVPYMVKNFRSLWEHEGQLVYPSDRQKCTGHLHYKMSSASHISLLFLLHVFSLRMGKLVLFYIFQGRKQYQKICTSQ